MHLLRALIFQVRQGRSERSETCCLTKLHGAVLVSALLMLAATGGGNSAFGAGPNLFVNHAFEAGNTGFGSDLGYVATPPFGGSQNGVYAIAQYPHDWFPYLNTWASMGDHTSGSGNMLLATPNPGSDRIWYESVDVIAGTTYLFSGWAAHVSHDDPNVANLSINVGNTSLGLFNLAALSVASWGSFSFTYTPATSGLMVFSITDLALDNYGNDFALDDLSLVAIPEPAATGVFCGMSVFGAALLLGLRRRCRLGK